MSDAPPSNGLNTLGEVELIAQRRIHSEFEADRKMRTLARQTHEGGKGSEHRTP